MTPQTRKRIMVMDQDERRSQEIIEILEADDHFGYWIDDIGRAMNQIYNDPPDIILLATTGDHWKTFLRTLKTDTVFRYLPVLGLFEQSMLGPTTSFENFPIDDFLFLPLDLNELRLRVRLAIMKSGRYLDANPLTRLPGNYTILQTVQGLIDDNMPFALVYVDLDNFKPFNDAYGFSRGDEILRMTARVLVNSIRNLNDSIGFVGHIGGDDFVIVVDPASIETACKQVISNLGLIVGTFYDDVDRMRGYIQSVDRQGNKNKFPLLTVSLAAVISTSHDYTHFGEFSSAASEVKKEVKKLDGSNFLIDRRHTKNEEKQSAEEETVS